MKYKGDIKRKTLPRVMLGVLSAKTVVQKTFLFFQDNYNPIYNSLVIWFLNQTITIKPKIVKAFHKLELVKISFFSLAISEWKKLDKHIHNSDNISIFKTKIFKFARPNCHHPKGVKLLTLLQLGLSHFCKNT